MKQVKDTYPIKDLKKYAEANNLRLVVPEEDELQLDIDSDADFEIFKQHIAILQERSAYQWKFKPSRSKPQGKHITVRLPGGKFTPLKRIALQAALGSDRKRELLSILDLENGDPMPTVFFEKP